MRAGLAYERRVLRKLKLLYPDLKASPWIVYKAPKKSGICQPDALLVLPDGRLIVIEIKLSRMPQVRQKLMQFYGPLVQLLYPKHKLCYLQIYKNTKPSAHKRPVNFYELETIKPGTYRECHHLV